MIAGLLGSAAPASATDSLFAALVEASTASDGKAMTRLLRSRTLSTSSAVLDAGNRLRGGAMRHGVPAAELVDKLAGCVVDRWRDVGNNAGGAFILWHCPARRVPENRCYFYAYRAQQLSSPYHPPNFYIGEVLAWDHALCGRRWTAPPAPPAPPGERG